MRASVVDVDGFASTAGVHPEHNELRPLVLARAHEVDRAERDLCDGGPMQTERGFEFVASSGLTPDARPQGWALGQTGAGIIRAPASWTLTSSPTAITASVGSTEHPTPNSALPSSKGRSASPADAASEHQRWLFSTLAGSL